MFKKRYGPLPVPDPDLVDAWPMCSKRRKYWTNNRIFTGIVLHIHWNLPTVPICKNNLCRYWRRRYTPVGPASRPIRRVLSIVRIQRWTKRILERLKKKRREQRRLCATLFVVAPRVYAVEDIVKHIASFI